MSLLINTVVPRKRLETMTLPRNTFWSYTIYFTRNLSTADLVKEYRVHVAEMLQIWSPQSDTFSTSCKILSRGKASAWPTLNWNRWSKSLIIESWKRVKYCLFSRILTSTNLNVIVLYRKAVCQLTNKTLDILNLMLLPIPKTRRQSHATERSYPTLIS